MSSTSSSSHWHVVTPQTRPLTLTILELTPLALTLSLTLAPLPSSPPYGRLPTQHVVHSQNHTLGPSKYRKKTRHRRPESDDELTAVDADDDSSSPLPGTYPVSGLFEGGTNFKDLLSHGVVVSVNGQPWSRIVAHVSDLDDEDAGESEAVEGGEEGEWEDESDHAVEGGMEEGMTRRRPRKARFSLSAGDAVRSAASGEGGGERRRKRTEKDKGKWEKDRAVVVVYGLSPAKEYEVELRVVGPSGQDRELLGKLEVLQSCL